MSDGNHITKFGLQYSRFLFDGTHCKYGNFRLVDDGSPYIILKTSKIGYGKGTSTDIVRIQLMPVRSSVW